MHCPGAQLLESRSQRPTTVVIRAAGASAESSIYAVLVHVIGERCSRRKWPYHTEPHSPGALHSAAGRSCLPLLSAARSRRRRRFSPITSLEGTQRATRAAPARPFLLPRTSTAAIRDREGVVHVLGYSKHISSVPLLSSIVLPAPRQYRAWMQHWCARLVSVLHAGSGLTFLHHARQEHSTVPRAAHTFRCSPARDHLRAAIVTQSPDQRERDEHATTAHRTAPRLVSAPRSVECTARLHSCCLACCPSRRACTTRGAPLTPPPAPKRVLFSGRFRSGHFFYSFRVLSAAVQTHGTESRIRGRDCKECVCD